MYVCMYVCMYACKYVCIYLFMYVCMHVCMYFVADNHMNYKISFFKILFQRAHTNMCIGRLKPRT